MGANDVPKSVRGDLGETRAARRAASMRAYYEDRPTMSGVSKRQELERAAYRREQDRQMALKSENWDRLDTFTRDDMIGWHRQLSEAAISHALMMPGMVVRGAALSPKAVAKAEEMLGGRLWTDLTHAEKMAIKRKTGLEQITGAFRDWVKETPIDPRLSRSAERKLVNWGDAWRKNNYSFRGVEPPDAYHGGVVGDVRSVFSRDPGHYIDTLGDSADLTSVLFKRPTDPTLQSGLGASIEGYVHYPTPTGPAELVLTDELAANAVLEAAPEAYIQTRATHELGHVAHKHLIKPWMNEVPYGFRPQEIESFVIEERSGLNPAARRITLMEESHPAILRGGRTPETFYRDVLNDQQEALQRHATRQDAKGGDTRADAKGGDASGVPAGSSVPPDYRGPRIVINPTTFHNSKDAACVAWNESFRITMEDMGFEPVSEPTDEQRKFFSDTAYADDELQLRRTILARVCTFDTSVRRPTDEQLQEAVEFLENVMEAGYPQNEWEQSSVQRMHDVIASVPMGQKEEAPEPPEDRGTVEADVGGGAVEDAFDEEFSGVLVDGELVKPGGSVGDFMRRGY